MKKPREKFNEFGIEQAAIGTYLDTELADSKTAILIIAGHSRHTAAELAALEAHQRSIELGEIDGITEPIFRNITRLNRAWTPEILQDIYDGLRCPLDLSLHADRFGVAE